MRLPSGSSPQWPNSSLGPLVTDKTQNLCIGSRSRSGRHPVAKFLHTRRMNDTPSSDRIDATAEVAVAERTRSRFGHLGRDLLASVVVFLVALPLCMGIAIASGVPVAYGLITGIVGGLLVGTIAGAPLQVSGPAAGLAVIIFELVQDRGAEVLGITVLIAGLIQGIAGIFRLGQYFRAVSPAVIEGMLAGIGVLIFASQFHVMVDDAPRKNGLSNLLAIPDAVRKGLPWPTLSERPIRTAVVAANQDVGELHDDQLRLQEAFVSHFDGEQADREFDWAAARIAQERIVDRLTQVNARLRGANVFAGRRGEEREAALAVAVLASEQVRAAIDDRDDVAEAYESAEAGILAFERTLKNHNVAAKLGLLTIFTIVVWQLLPANVRIVPAPLVAILVATTVASAFAMPVMYVEVPQNLLADAHHPTWTTLTKIDLQATLLSAVVIAIVASAETLLCATAVDQLHTGPRTRYDRELFAQGVGNTVCGLLGSLPMTGVIVRSAANVQAGGKTRASAILHGLWLLLLCWQFPQILRMIPVASLAAILVYTGYRLMGFSKFLHLWKTRRAEAFIFLATVSMIVATDLLTGVVTGVILAGGKLLKTVSKLQIDAVDHGSGGHTLRLNGAATFVSLPKLASALEQVSGGSRVEIDLQGLQLIDHSCVELLKNFEKQHAAGGGRLTIDWPQISQADDRSLVRPVDGSAAQTTAEDLADEASEFVGKV